MPQRKLPDIEEAWQQEAYAEETLAFSAFIILGLENQR